MRWHTVLMLTCCTAKVTKGNRPIQKCIIMKSKLCTWHIGHHPYLNKCVIYWSRTVSLKRGFILQQNSNHSGPRTTHNILWPAGGDGEGGNNHKLIANYCLFNHSTRANELLLSLGMVIMDMDNVCCWQWSSTNDHYRLFLYLQIVENNFDSMCYLS